MRDISKAVLHRPFARYSTAIGVVAASYLLRWILAQGLGLHMPTFITFYPGIMLVAVLAGLGPGLLATALAVLAADYFIVPPPGSFGVSNISDAVALALFAAVGIFMSLLAEGYRRSLLSIAAYKVEQSLWVSNEKLDVALASMTDAVFISDAKGRFLQFNDAFATFHKFADKSTCARTLAEYPEFLEVSTADGQVAPLEMWAVPRALRGETATNEEYRLRRKDTGETWIGSYSFSPVRDNEGAIVGSVVVGRDITEQKRAEKKLRESEVSLAEAQARVHLGSWEVGLATWEGKWSAEMSRLYYRDPSIAAPDFEEFLQLVHPEDREVLVSQRDHISDFGDQFEFESRTNPSIGPMRHLNNTFYVIRDAAGIPVRLGGTAQDITERKRAEEALRVSERRYSALFANKTNAIAQCRVIADADGRPVDYLILNINEAYERVIGMKKEDVEGRRVKEAFPGVENYGFDYIGVLGKVGLGGGEITAEAFLEATGQTLSVYAYSPLDGEFIAIFTDITESKRAEEALRKSETLYHGLFDSMTEGFCIIEMIFDAEGKAIDCRFLEANAAFERQIGLHDAVGKRLREHAPSIEDYWFEIYGKVALTGEPIHFFNHSEALHRSFEVSAYRVGAPEQRHVAVVFSDITKRVHTEEALKRSMEQLQIFVEHAPASLAMFDMEMRYICASRRWFADYGLGDRELRGMSHYEVFPGIPERWKEAHRRAMSGEVVQAEDDSFIRADGSLQRLRWEIRPWREPSGVVGGIVVFTEDITEQKTAEEALRKSETLYHGLFDLMDEGFCIIEMIFDAEGKAADYRFLEINASFERQTGLHDAAGKRMRELAPNHEEFWFESYGKIALTGEPVHLVNEAKALKGYYEVSAYRVGEPELRQVAIVFNDISERMRAEAHIQQLVRVYAVLSDINQAIVRGRDSQALLEAACRIAVEKGQFRMAWIGMINPTTQMLEPVAWSGVVDGYLELIKIDFSGPEFTTGPGLLWMETGKHAVCDDIELELNRPWTEAALKRGYRSSAALLLRCEGRVIGVFGIYSSELAFFDEEETKLLDELAMDIGFALEVYQLEERRVKAEEHVKQLNRLYSVLSDVNEMIVRERDSQVMLETACRIAVDKGKLQMAWIGMVDPVTKLLEPVAWSGVVEGFLEMGKLSVRDPDPEGRPATRCFATGKHSICNDVEEDIAFRPLREEAIRRGYWSGGAFPLKVEGELVGAFILYANTKGFFEGDDVSLLDEMAMDISFALEVNRREEERRKAEVELRWRTAFFEAQVDSAPDGVLVVDGKGKRILQNQRLNALLKLPQDAFENLDFAERIQFLAGWVKNPDQFLEKVQFVRSHPEEISRDIVELLDGTVLERISAPVIDKAQNYYGRILTLRDITAQRQLEEQLRQSQKMEAVGQLTGGIAHDFNNLLTVILGCSEFIGEESEGNPRLSKMAKMILDAAQRGADLTHRMLAFARRQTLQPKPVDIHRMLANMESILRRTLSADINLEVVQSGEDCTALVDPPQLESALLNLCVNARDAMPGGGKLTVETGIATLDSSYAELNLDVTPGQYILISVSDTGCGISPENLSRVFDPFFTTKEVGKGTGLGLSMVYGFVKQSKGHVKIYSEPGHGTSVKLYLPMGERKSKPSNHEAIPTADHPVSGIILLVEDNEPVREFAKTQLSYLGYQVLEAAHGKEALAILREHPEIDLLFTDVVMPGGLNGRDLALEARKLYPALKVLFSSGYAESAILDMGLLDEHVQLLNKPYSRLQLERRIRGMLTAGTSAPAEGAEKVEDLGEMDGKKHLRG